VLSFLLLLLLLLLLMETLLSWVALVVAMEATGKVPGHRGSLKEEKEN